MSDFSAAVDSVSMILSGYIFVVGVGRLASMGWWTHKRLWILVYALLVMWAAGNVLLVLDGKGHSIPVMGLLATTIWFRESRQRWRERAPPYMSRDCADSKLMRGGQ